QGAQGEQTGDLGHMDQRDAPHGDARRQVGSEEREGQKGDNGETIEDAFDRTGGERGGEPDSGEPGGRVGPNQLSRTKRQDAVRQEPNGDGVPERGRRKRPAPVIAQEQAPERKANRKGGGGDQDRGDKGDRLRRPDMVHYLIDGDPAQGPQQQAEGERDADQAG